ncbi:MAG: tail fiber domain-containing protein, partial [Chitinophagaceae bacterium]|nr:tail fiber domain-containing protein [Chitinophagaceae bacterium]
AVGSLALHHDSVGHRSTAIGSQCLIANRSSDNTAVGYLSLGSNTTGSQNTALGTSSGSNLTIGSNNILIGYNAQPSAANVNNEVTLGNPGNNVYRMYAASWTYVSDRRLKSDIKDIRIGLDFVKTLRPAEFVYKNAKNGQKTFGFIAQEVQEAMHRAGLQGNYGLVNVFEEKDQILGMNTTELIPILTKAIQEQQQLIEQQQKQIEVLTKLVEELRKKQ